MRRRDFLKWQLSGALWLAAGAPLPGVSSMHAPLFPLPSGPGVAQAAQSATSASGTTPDVAVVKGAPAAATHACVGMLGGMGRFVKTGQKVVIKPNMSFASAASLGTNTHPEVVAALVRMCRDAGAASVLVLDNPLAPAEQCIERSGIRTACAEFGDIVQAPTAERFYRELDIDGAQQMTANTFLRDALDADVLIAAPTAKSHSSTGVSLGLKGMMGLIRQRGVMHSRYDLDTAIVDLNTRLRAALTVIDGTYVLSTGGPGGPGKVLQENTVIASADPVSADACAVESFEWYGRRFAARQVSHIRLAHERGLGSMDLAARTVTRITL
ncbi:DUF362 domain-containing protein [Nitratidesulfovibrio termitidis]|uniref:DUF362 domain-containing protein n=1 Tax=Nitratidesulfovibrio termitidis TaxID=42252 RepID=UPI000407E4C2|nr:DUF362 domain-containing protein [Nitratidesulfovibrio termitidis]